MVNKKTFQRIKGIVITGISIIALSSSCIQAFATDANTKENEISNNLKIEKDELSAFIDNENDNNQEKEKIFFCFCLILNRLWKHS